MENIMNLSQDANLYLNKKITLKGYIKSARNHGAKQFIDVIYDNQEIQVVDMCNNTYKKGNAIEVHGTVILRDGNNINVNKKHGMFEIAADSIKILSKILQDMPFNCYDNKQIGDLSDEIKHKHRALFLRSEYMQNNIAMRAKLLRFCREFMHSNHFLEIQTPILTSSTPEGARDFIIPSRLYPGKFYALPQSPQQFKQALMASGFKNYYSIAPCFRDEDGRKDRAFGEFYQLDMECSFANSSQILNLLCRFVVECIHHFIPLAKINIMYLTYDKALEDYSSDKPDLRITEKTTKAPEYITSLNIFKNQKNVKCLRVKISYEQAQNIYNQRDSHGVLFEYIHYSEGITRGKLNKIISSHDLQEGECLFFAGGENCNKAMSFVRNMLVKILPNITDYAIVIVHQFPMFEKDDNGNPTFCHNPFSALSKGISCVSGDIYEVKENYIHNMKQFIEKQLSHNTSLNSNNDNLYDIKAEQYDIVLNGYELASGSERNTDLDELLKYFTICGYNPENVKKEFNLIFDSFSYGIAPHAGAAIGIERLLMILLNIDNLRDVVAFPLPNSGYDPLTNTPKTLPNKILEELKIKIDI